MSKKRHILVVDDEPKVAFFFQQHLQLVDASYVAKAVNSGPEAIAELKKQSYDLLITDLRMPKMNGLELLHHVRQISPKTKTILVTAYGSDDVWQRARQLDISHGLSKPVKINELLATVKELLAQSPSSTNANYSGLLVLSGERFEQLFTMIDQLRSELGSHVGVLSDTAGRILVRAGSNEEMDLSSITALLGGTMAASSELLRHLDYPKPVHLSYYEGPPYDIYAAYLGQGFLLTLIYDRRHKREPSRIGMVWLYTQRTIEKLVHLLQQSPDDDTPPPLGADFASTVAGELDSLFGDAPQTAVSPPPTPPQSLQPTQPQTAEPNSPLPTLVSTVEQLLKQVIQNSGINVQYDLSGLATPLPPDTTRLTFRVLTVGLKNIQTHAQAQSATITFKRDAKGLYGTIQDDGKGCHVNEISANSTLATLQKQFKKAKGNLLFLSQPGQGTTIRFQLPV